MHRRSSLKVCLNSTTTTYAYVYLENIDIFHNKKQITTCYSSTFGFQFPFLPFNFLFVLIIVPQIALQSSQTFFFLFSNGIIGKPGSKFQIPARVLCPQSPEVKSNFVSLHISMDKCVNKFGNIFVFCLLNMTKIKQFIPKNKTNLGINYFEGSEY